MEERFVGIDVSKARLEVAVLPGEESWGADNTEAGITELVKRVRALHPKLVVLEASGGYERDVGAALWSAHTPVVVVNPRQVRDFARATGQLAKTDALDAKVLARFAEAVKPPVRALPDTKQEDLRGVLARRRQVVEMLTAEKNRLRTSTKGGPIAHQGPHCLVGRATTDARCRAGSAATRKRRLARTRGVAPHSHRNRADRVTDSAG